MSIKMLAASAVVLFFTAFSAASVQAVPITLGDDQYVISTVEGTYNDLLPDLSNTPWFSSIALANSAARQAALSSNVFFAFSVGGGQGTGYSVLGGGNTLSTVLNRQILDPAFFTRQNTFALATLVPPPTALAAPNTLLLLLSGMMLIAARLRRA